MLAAPPSPNLVVKDDENDDDVDEDDTDHRNGDKRHYDGMNIDLDDTVYRKVCRRIPTVKLKNPGKAFLKSESRTSVTFKL